jgi:hypothetical protein
VTKRSPVGGGAALGRGFEGDGVERKVALAFERIGRAIPTPPMQFSVWRKIQK